MLLTQTDVITIFQNTLATLRDEERKKKERNKETKKQRKNERNTFPHPSYSFCFYMRL